MFREIDLTDVQLENLPQVDEIGPWSLVKHDIIGRYAQEYSRILSRQKKLSHYYIDAFSSAGIARKKQSGEFVKTSPLIVLDIEPKFKGYYFIDLNREKLEFLQERIKGRNDVKFFNEDSNEVLCSEVFPEFSYDSYRRALCLLDPYGMNLNWNVLEAAGSTGSVEVFINFPTADINRNVLREDSTKRLEESEKRMTSFWGNDSWRNLTYTNNTNLFGEVSELKARRYPVLVEEYKKRLTTVAGFKCVLDPLPMRHPDGPVLYHLFFASPNETGSKIVKHIFKKYHNFGEM